MSLIDLPATEGGKVASGAAAVALIGVQHGWLALELIHHLWQASISMPGPLHYPATKQPTTTSAIFPDRLQRLEQQARPSRATRAVGVHPRTSI